LEDFKSEVIIESPGRINLIGEHIDYNGGNVLPAAINLKITLSFRKNDKILSSVWSKNYNVGFSFDSNNVKKSDKEWENYILGVVYQINIIEPNFIKGFDCIIDSKLPIGAGISSSAALECGMAKGLNELFKIGLTDEQIISLSRNAEHTFIGTKCGIMDQFAVVRGVKNCLIHLNCKTELYEIIEADFSPYSILLLNTNVSHNLATSEYNKRQAECNIALQKIRLKYPEYEFLADVPQNTVEEFKNKLPKETYDRALFVSQENSRVFMAVEAIKAKSFKEFGNLMYESHDGLQNLYNVSCKELDFLVEYSKGTNYILGSRMMGGGFGGCTINLIHQDFVEEYIRRVSIAYKEQFKIELTSIMVTIGDGVHCY